MRTLRRSAIIAGIIAATWLSACSPNETRPARDHFHLSIVQNDSQHRFDISLSSAVDRQLCVSVDNWPNSSGYFSVEYSDIALEIGNSSLPSKSPLLSKYCPGGCGFHRIEPRGVLSGFIAYDAFGDPAQIAAAAEKRLTFEVFPIYCPSR